MLIYVENGINCHLISIQFHGRLLKTVLQSQRLTLLNDFTFFSSSLKSLILTRIRNRNQIRFKIWNYIKSWTRIRNHQKKSDPDSDKIFSDPIHWFRIRNKQFRIRILETKKLLIQVPPDTDQ